MPVRFLILITLAALGGCAFTVSENNIVRARPGETVASGTSQNGVWTIEALSVEAGPAVFLRGAAFRKKDSVATVLYFGGNGFVLSQHYQYILPIYQDLPVDVVIFDHRGYGGSDGTPSIDELMNDGVLVYDHVKAMPSVSAKPLIVHGHSLGSFVAGNVASRRRLDGLVLESSATTAEEWVKGFADHSVWIRKVSVGPLLKGKGNLAIMGALDEPVLVVVGEDDETTRPEMAESLFEQAAVPDEQKELLVVAGAGHMDAARGVGYRAAFMRLLHRADKKTG